MNNKLKKNQGEDTCCLQEQKEDDHHSRLRRGGLHSRGMLPRDCRAPDQPVL